MKTDTSTNLMLVIFCLALIGFVIFSSKVNVNIKAKQALIEKGVDTKH
ncbi:MAG: hypothetical protein M9931_08305 [Chitinophagales bacterium]|jgi:hypothetical protein|nr:hypothetical protein [Chitinophagales bacterium]HRN95360.1 hypothetical protein [Chitinophagales bacterium]HRP39511.1 hypothetical protein [Chitinophagales bacterium]